ncbi:MAG: hypothetical protein WD602_09910 [Actinomycetota bacterium]
MSEGGRSRFSGRALVSAKIAAVLALLAVAMGGVALLRAGGQQQAGPVQPEDYGRVYEALCDAGPAVRAGNPTQVGDAFYGEVHAGLHSIAEELAEVDRPLAADLLRSKNAVERALDSSNVGRLASHWDELLRVSQMALESLGAPYPLCSI